MAPTGVPQAVVTKLHAEVVKALRRPDVQAELASQGASPMIDKGPDVMVSYMISEGEKWGKVIKGFGSKVQ